MPCKYVLTFINHADCELTQDKVESFCDRIVGRISKQYGVSVVLTHSKRLSPRAFDQYITTTGAIGKECLSGGGDECNGDADGMDVILQKDDEHRQGKKLFVFDMDSTLIYQEVIELIAAYADVEPQVREITNRAMNNEIDFKESLKQRVMLLKGLKIDKLYDEIKLKLQLTQGVVELCQFLKARGVKLAVLSGGFVPFAQYIQTTLNMDYMRANVLECDSQGHLTGHTLGDVVDGQCKAQTLVSLCDQYGVSIEESCMVGDGGNDLPAMGVAGFGIAWNAKPRVQAEAPSKLNTKSLLDVLYILGYTDEEIRSQ